MAKETPMAAMKRQYGSKEQLVDQLTSNLEQGDEAELKERLKTASNKQLLRLMKVSQAVKEQGGKAALIDKLVGAQGRSKDEDYKTKLSSYSLPRLFDLTRAAERRAKRA